MKHLGDKFRDAFNAINKSNRVLIISHRSPDGDTVGSNYALNEIIRIQFGKSVTSACVDPLPYSLNYIPFKFQKSFRINDFDLVISVDCSNIDQTGYNNLLNINGKIINFDHHSTNTNFGNINIVDHDACSTTEILVDFFQYISANFSPTLSTALLTGIYTDTGSFMHSNTTKSAFRASSFLIKKGAKLSVIVNNLFKKQSIGQLKLWGKVLKRAKLNENGNVVSKITENDFTETHTTPNDLSGVINYLNSVPNSGMSILISEDTKGNVKGSMRSSFNNMDVAEICKKFGGGGHKKAAGFTIPGKIVGKEVWKITD